MATRKHAKKIDLQELFSVVEHEARAGVSVPKGLSRVVAASIVQGLDVDESAIEKLPIRAELKRLEGWFATLWSPKPPPKQKNAIYFGIVEFEDGTFDFHVMAVPGKRADTEDWNFSRAASPPEEYANSNVLARLSRSDGPTRDATGRHLLCLAYVVLTAAYLCRKHAKLLAPRKSLVAAGYDEGDLIALGQLAADGTFGAATSAEPPAQGQLPGPTLVFHIEDIRGKDGGWLLDDPEAPGARDLPDEFALRGRRERVTRCETTISSKGKPRDLSFTHSDILVVSQRIAELLSAVAGKDVQRIALSIEGVDEPFELINVLTLIPSRKFLDWSKQHRQPPDRASSLGKANMARTGVADLKVVVSRQVAEALAAAGATGLKLVPLAKKHLT